jgi:hypothetical protein
MARLDRSAETLRPASLWPALVRFCLGVVSLGATIYLGVEVYACSILREFGDHAKILGLRVPYSLLIPVLAVLCLLAAFVTVYVFFFPAQSPEI